MDRKFYERMRHYWACYELEREASRYARGTYGFARALPAGMTREQAEELLDDANCWRTASQRLTPRQIAAVTAVEPYRAFDYTPHKLALMARGFGYGWNSAKQKMEWSRHARPSREIADAQAA